MAGLLKPPRDPKALEPVERMLPCPEELSFGLGSAVIGGFRVNLLTLWVSVSPSASRG